MSQKQDPNQKLFEHIEEHGFYKAMAKESIDEYLAREQRKPPEERQQFIDGQWRDPDDLDGSRMAKQRKKLGAGVIAGVAILLAVCVAACIHMTGGF